MNNTNSTLEVIQKLSKLGKILSMIAWIFCTVGAVGCLIGILCLPFADIDVIKLGGMTLHSFIVNESGVDINTYYATLAGEMIVCIGGAITGKYAENYFKNELKAGTPFTYALSKQLLQLGIIAIAVPLGTSILAEIVASIVSSIIDCGKAYEFSTCTDISLGVMLIVISLICKYGAELFEQREFDLKM